jgi:hypothetical protein
MRKIRKPDGPNRSLRRGEVPLHERMSPQDIMDMSMDEYATYRLNLLHGASEETKRWYQKKGKIVTYTDALVCREADASIQRPLETEPWNECPDWLWSKVALELKVRRDQIVEDMCFAGVWRRQRLRVRRQRQVLLRGDRRLGQVHE